MPWFLKQGHAKRHTPGLNVQIGALNSSWVLDETTEEGRLFHTGIVLGKNEFFRASLISMVSGIWCNEIREMPWFLKQGHAKTHTSGRKV